MKRRPSVPEPVRRSLWSTVVVVAATVAACLVVIAVAGAVRHQPLLGTHLAVLAAGALAAWLATWHHYVGRRTGLRLRSILDHRARERDRRRREAADELTQLRMLGHAVGPVRPGLKARGGLP
jgi:hypothetical protein